MKRRTQKKQAARLQREKQRDAKRELGSHLYLEPHSFYQRMFRIEIPRAAFDRLQQSHFTYYYMPQPRPSHNGERHEAPHQAPLDSDQKVAVSTDPRVDRLRLMRQRHSNGR